MAGPASGGPGATPLLGDLRYLPRPAGGDPLLVHLHVPKTAGTTVKIVLGAMFGAALFSFNDLMRDTAGSFDIDAALAADPRFYDRCRAITGHVDLAHPLVRRATRPVVLLAVLRDPVERTVSHYDYIRAVARHPLKQELAGRSLLRAFEEVPAFRAASVDSQLRQVFGTTAAAAARQVLAEGRYCLGRLDRLQAFLEALEGITGIPRRWEIPHVTRANPRRGVALARDQADHAEALSAIAAANAAEIEFIRAMPDVMLSGIPAHDGAGQVRAAMR